jgi:hypothetical protein
VQLFAVLRLLLLLLCCQTLQEYLLMLLGDLKAFLHFHLGRLHTYQALWKSPNTHSHA